jgi:hypothetical protein
MPECRLGDQRDACQSNRQMGQRTAGQVAKVGGLGRRAPIIGERGQLDRDLGRREKMVDAILRDGCDEKIFVRIHPRHHVAPAKSVPRRAGEDEPRPLGSGSTARRLNVLVASSRSLHVLVASAGRLNVLVAQTWCLDVFVVQARRLDVLPRLRRGARDACEQRGSQKDCCGDLALHVVVLLRCLVRADRRYSRRHARLERSEFIENPPEAATNAEFQAETPGSG